MFNEELFYSRLAELRMKKGVSARKMSRALGQGDSYINNIENKNNFPKMQTFFYICEYLGITPLEFFDMDSCDPSRLSVLFEKIKRLNEEQLAVVESVVDNLK